MVNRRSTKRKIKGAVATKKWHPQAKRRMRNRGAVAVQYTNYLLEPHPEM
jgi:hypothetical protein